MNSEDETSLRDHSIQLRDQYRELDEIVDGMLSNASDIHFGMELIRSRMQGITDTEAVLRPLRDQYESVSDSSELQTVQVETVTMLEKLLPKIGELEKRAHERTKLLKPQIQSSVRAVEMQAAYRAGSR